jgi:hypothetical protein
MLLILLRFLVNCCLPLRCLCFGHRCLPSRLPLLAADANATVVRLQTAAPCSFRRNHVMFKILHLM